MAAMPRFALPAAALPTLAALLTIAGCTSTTPTPSPSASPTASPSATAPPSPTASPSASPTASLDTTGFLPLPEVLAGIPLGGGPSAEIAPATQRRLAPDPLTGHAFQLGHCGLLGPLDFDGSLWVARGAHNGLGGPISEEQLIELLNATPVRIFLLDDEQGLLVTPGNAFVLLARHEGPRHYALCD